MQRPRQLRFAWPTAIQVCVLTCALGCGADEGAAATDSTDAKQTAGGDAQADGGASGAADSAATDTAAAALDTTTAPPSPPTPYAYSGGDCPKLAAGQNTLFSWDTSRSVDLYLPAELKSAGLLFLWHGLGDSKENFGKATNAQAQANILGAIVAVPQSKGAATGWGWASDDSALRDVQLFDDLVTCIDKQFDIDNERIYTMGFSAGALWSSYLVINRSTFLAAAVIWSGGTGSTAYKYKTPKRKIPVLASWGGKNDNAVLSFAETTGNFVGALTKDGHYVIACDHGLGHTIPPNGLNWGMKFLQAHRWATLTNTPFKGGDTSAFPGYCVFSQ